MRSTWILFLTALSVHALPIYTVNFIAPAGSSETRPYALNDVGYLAGVTSNGTISQGFTWINGVFTVIPNLGGWLSESRGIDHSGNAAGYSITSTGDVHPYIYTFAGDLIDVSAAVAPYAITLGMNSSGVLIGTGSQPGNPDTVWVYDSITGNTTWIPNMGGDFGWPNSINSSGAITGYQRTSNGPNALFAAFLYEGGVLTDLGGFGGSSYGSQINNAGGIAGFSQTSPGGPRNAFYRAPGSTTLLNLHPASGWLETLATDSSPDGRVIAGIGYRDDGAKRAIAWFDGVFVDMNIYLPPGSGLEFRSVGFVNDQGQIAGYAARDSDGVVLTVLLTPVPEPSTFLLSATILLLISGYRRKNR